jgi:hypothetical protein
VVELRLIAEKRKEYAEMAVDKHIKSLVRTILDADADVNSRKRSRNAFLDVMITLTPDDADWVKSRCLHVLQDSDADVNSLQDARDLFGIVKNFFD